MKTIGREFISYLEELLGLEFGKDLFYMRTPDVDTPVFWLVQTGGHIKQGGQLREKIKEYDFILNYRDTTAENVDKTIYKTETILNHIGCIRFKHSVVYKLSVANLGSDEDLDSEDRYRGTLQISLSVYDNYSK